MSCNSRSENSRASCVLLVKVAGEVVNAGVWQSAQPTERNRSDPRWIDVAPPGDDVDGVGGASMRIKAANSTTSPGSVPDAPSSDVGLKRHCVDNEPSPGLLRSN